LKTKIKLDQFCSQKHQLIHYVHDLFQAGTETVTSTLRWSILCFLHYPESQQKFYKEVIQIMGMDVVCEFNKISFHFIAKSIQRQRFNAQWFEN